MNIVQLDKITEKEMVPGFWGKFVHSDHVTLAIWRVEAGAALPPHVHPHEQVTTLLEGKFELTIAGESHQLSPGMIVVIPSNVPHSGRAISSCRIIDVFYPPRQEYQSS